MEKNIELYNNEIDQLSKNISFKLDLKDNSIKKVRKEGLDKFYTNNNISEKCLKTIEKIYEWSKWELVIEPSAGNGSFLKKIPINKKIGIDILPDDDDIIKQDFLTYYPDNNIKKILIVGNPPFGKGSSLAIKFFNHAAKWGNVIAFIIPRTFRRISIQNKLNINFHLILDDDIPINPCSFTPNMMVKCCFQIWEKKENKREKVKLETKHKDWKFIGFGPKDEKGQPTPPTDVDFAIRAYGGKCGEIIDKKLELLRPKSWHWIKSNIDLNILIQRFKNLDYSLSLNTARQNSIGMGELVKLYKEKYD
mgnify:CR=1 FL=1|tara:strand:- start:680 stop:1600 length:921 start_codon:yes stop_codon:yes gene_type:complete